MVRDDSGEKTGNLEIFSAPGLQTSDSLLRYCVEDQMAGLKGGTVAR